tara:strand:- start:1299 stop:2732 length:1434 start_codon:yes stop_codon:yes gene_type:complete
MARITDPDQLNQGTEVNFITGSNKLIQLNIAGNLEGENANGVTWQALYSFVKEEWKNDDNLVKFAFPLISITTEQFELINTWNLSGSLTDVSASQYLVRDGGWAVVNPAGSNTEEWMNLTTLGSFLNSTDTAYYYQEATTGDVINTIYPNTVNQGIRIFASASDDAQNFDYRSFFKVYLRERAATYGFYDLLTEQNLSALTYRKFALPLSSQTDLNISATDNTIETTSPYTGMSLNYFTSSFTVDFGSGVKPFKVQLDGNSGSLQQIYEWTQYQLRQASNIDSGSNLAQGVTGSVAEELLEFVGASLKTKLQTDVSGSGPGGVYLIGFASADTNNLVFVDDSGSDNSYPFVAAGNLLFNTNLTNDSAAIYKLFFTNDNAGDNTGRDFGTQDAIIILNNGSQPITGSVNGSSSISFNYDYDNNIQRGSNSSGSDVPFTGVGLGLETAQYVVVTGTWTRSTANSVNFVASLERNYSNPV